jgi:porin
VLYAVGASAQPAAPDAAPAPALSASPAVPASSSSGEAGPFGFLGAASTSSNLLGDMWGLRPFLSRYGVTLTIQEQSEILGNANGGKRQGFEYDGLTTATLQADTQAAFGWYGGLFSASALQAHGRDLSADNLLSLQAASDIEAIPSTRLWELWYQQKFLDDKLDVKIGQQSLDPEFMVSQNGNYFINASFGWPTLPSADMPGGGPVYPLSALGVRVRAHPTDTVTILAGVFNGSPVANNSGDPQMRNPSGVSFPLNGGALAIAEVQFAYPSAGGPVETGGSQSPAGVYKIGVWYDSENFADLRYSPDSIRLKGIGA